MNEAAPDPRNLIESLGPNAQPHRASMNLAALTSSNGQKFVVMVVSTPSGRFAPWLTPEDAVTWGEALIRAGQENQKQATPLHVARTIPPGTPLPGSPLIGG